jgi:hypothetical protein
MHGIQKYSYGIAKYGIATGIAEHRIELNWIG